MRWWEDRNPAEFLKDFRGFLQADAYGGYDGIYTGSGGAIVEVGCWAHARNKFADADNTAPELVLAAKAWVRRLYDVEDEAKTLSSAERLRLQIERSNSPSPRPSPRKRGEGELRHRPDFRRQMPVSVK